MGPAVMIAPGSRLEKAPQLLGARGVAQLAQGFGLDLTDALAGDREILPNFFERVLAAVRESEPQTQHLLLAGSERVEHAIGLLPEREPDHALDGRARLLVLDEIAQVAVLLLADGGLERNGLLGDLEDLADLVNGHFHLHRDLFRRGLPAELLDELAGGPDELVDGLDHVDGDADGAGLVGDGSCDRLTDPPGRVGRELVAAPVLELVDGLHQADIAFLDQVEELQSPVRVLFGDGDDEAKVGLDHLLLGARRLGLARLDDLDDLLELLGAGIGAFLGALDLLLGYPDQAVLDRGIAGGGLLVEVAVALVAIVVRERGEKRVDGRGRRSPAVGPERDLALGAMDLLHQLLEIEPPGVEQRLLEIEAAEDAQHLGLLGQGLVLDALPGGLALALALAAAGLDPQPARLGDEPLALAEQPVDLAELADHRPAKRLLFFFR